MCTLTYLLTDEGYELFFNRDEQLSRPIAKPPQYFKQTEAIYPIDPLGKGTWVAVNNSGMCLALLNYYQAMRSDSKQNFISRGEIILSLIQKKFVSDKELKQLELKGFQPFQICIFNSNISRTQGKVRSFIWDSTELYEIETHLPITSSSQNYEHVKQKRQTKFNQLVNRNNPTLSQLREFHFSKESLQKYSVNMIREDARTVSISHIKVDQNISFKYFDNLNSKTKITEIDKT